MFGARTCAAPICIAPGWTGPTFAKRVSAAPSWKGLAARSGPARVYLRLARLDGADLSGADLRGVEGLTLKQLDAAVCDHETKLPEAAGTERDGG